MKTSKLMSKASHVQSHTFNAIRRSILADATDGVFKGIEGTGQILNILRKSKKESAIYNGLISLSAYTYKGVEANEGELRIEKSYKVKDVLEACEGMEKSIFELLLSGSEVDFSTEEKTNKNNAIKHADLQAVKALESLRLSKLDLDLYKGEDKKLLEKKTNAVKSAEKRVNKTRSVYEFVSKL